MGKDEGISSRNSRLEQAIVGQWDNPTLTLSHLVVHTINDEWQGQFYSTAPCLSGAAGGNGVPLTLPRFSVTGFDLFER